MSILYVASILMIACAALTYGVLTSVFGMQTEMASGLASFFILSIGPLREAMEKASIRRQERRQPEVHLPTREEKLVSPIKLLVLGSVMMFAATQIGGALGGFLFAVSVVIAGADVPEAFPIEAAGIVALPIMLVLVFWISHWIARNSRAYGFAVAILAVAVGRALAVGLDLVGFRHMPQVAALYAEGAGYIVFMATVTMMPAVALGYWRGRKMMEVAYLKFLTDVLPSGTKAAIFSLAAEEAQRSVNERRRPGGDLADRGLATA